MQLTINKEFLRRHLFALVILAGMGLWFGYDGFVRYPKTPAAELYETIESAKPPDSMTPEKLDAFKAQKIATQHGLCFVLLAISAAIGLHLLAVARLRLVFDDAGFNWRGKRYSYADIASIDQSRWAKKGILKLSLAKGSLTLDAWHHAGVEEFARKLPISKK